MQILTPRDQNWLDVSIDILTRGGVVLHPTDTAYGLAVDATNADAIEKVFALKRRRGKPLIMIIRDAVQAAKFVELIPAARLLMDEFFPGALTLVLPKKNTVPAQLTCGQPQVGIRQPDSPITQAISRAFNPPYTSTSANISGHPTPYTIQDSLRQLDQSQIELAIDIGPLPIRPTSTVVDLTQSPPRLLRPGPISLEEIQLCLNKKSPY